MNVTVFDKLDIYKKIFSEMRKMKRRPHVKIGIQGQAGLEKKVSESEGGGKFVSLGAVSLVQVATFHEFGGNPGPPERSFLRSTMDENKEKYFQLTEKLKSEIFAGKMTVKKALTILGMQIVADVKNKIRSGIAPPLAQSTIERKNSRIIKGAHANVSRLEKVMTAKGRLTASQKKSLNKSSDTILTGGKSVPLIDTGQLINSITYKVDMGDGSGVDE